MLKFLKNHPFAVEAFFESSFVLSFALPKEALQSLLPDCLVPDTHDDKWGFVAVAMVQTRGLRPKGSPRWLGNDFFLIGYRIFVRYTNCAGKRLRGLYILKSETDKRKMQYLGNLFTHYQYTTTNIRQLRQGNRIEITAPASAFNVTLETGDPVPPLPPGSPFADWKTARRFAGPLPFTFSFDAATSKVLVVEGVREDWQPLPISVTACTIPFLDTLPGKDIVLANAFAVYNIPYYWKKGKTEIWKP